MSSSELQIQSDFEIRPQRDIYSAKSLQISSQIPAEIHSSQGTEVEYRFHSNFERFIQQPQQMVAAAAIVALQRESLDSCTDDGAKFSN